MYRLGVFVSQELHCLLQCLISSLSRLVVVLHAHLYCKIWPEVVSFFTRTTVFTELFT